MHLSSSILGGGVKARGEPRDGTRTVVSGFDVDCMRRVEHFTEKYDQYHVRGR